MEYEGITVEVLKGIRGGSSINGSISATSATGTGAGASGWGADFLDFFLTGFFLLPAIMPPRAARQQQHDPPM